MELQIEKSVCANSRCFACGSLVYDVEKKKTTNHVYHKRCFCCRICKRNLTPSSLNEDGNDIYCENCYRKKQRGDCQSLAFQRAAEERGQFVYHDRHPDQISPLSRTRRPVLRSLSQSPSWSLRQLELQLRARETSPSLSTSSFVTHSPASRSSRRTSLDLGVSRFNSSSLPRVTSYPSPVTFRKFSDRSASTRDLRWLSRTGLSSPTASRPNRGWPAASRLELPLPQPKRIDLSSLVPARAIPPRATSSLRSPLSERKPVNQRTRFADVVFETMKSRVNQNFDALANDVDTFAERRASTSGSGKENSAARSGRERFRDAVSAATGRRTFSTSAALFRRKLN